MTWSEAIRILTITYVTLIAGGFGVLAAEESRRSGYLTEFWLLIIFLLLMILSLGALATLFTRMQRRIPDE